jgi:isopentenyl diphosphate isomerase/L-lactate dehydrogenase-like FMN-dependent dehydrogenase
MDAANLKKRALNVADMRRLAKSTLPRPVFDFADGGAEDEWTLRRNESAFDNIQLLPRPLRGSPSRDLSIELFGKKLSMPVMVGPTGLSGLLWPDGELCSARAAAAAGTAFCLSHASVCTIEELAATGVALRWMQVFAYHDPGLTREFIQRTKASGYDALVLTIDNQLTGNRERDIRNGFTIPPALGPIEIAAMAIKLPWLFRMRHHLKRVNMWNYVKAGEVADLSHVSRRLNTILDVSWRDIDHIRKIWTGPLILKGVLHPQEAHDAADHGVDGVIVSNHGGRQLDGAASSIEALPAIVAAAEGKISILLDGGVRRGVDVVKALSLGASACLIGRPQLWGLAVAGEVGVARVLQIFKDEISRVMGLCGVTTIGEIGADLIHRPK